MASVQGVWGIDIGQCGVKALRCVASDEPGKIRAEAFDFIEYPKILSQPEANPEEMVAEALQQFLSRNAVRGDRVAISVPGQSGLARFVKLPPVEVKKIPDLVSYEARNQIPFELDDVIWDYQQMGGGMIEEGFAIDIEIGLFAMKREQVLKYLKPFEKAGIEVDIVQLTPLSLYNYIVFDQLKDKLPEPELYDPENPPDSIMILSLGTDTTDLVITDGFRVWQRSLPIGGNHFTKALAKELKQTFAKAEHIKRNAAQAENPKALFQAMRPIFADLVTEVQRSMNFFANIHKKATIASGVALGNTAKLPGLVRFLSQNLKMPIQRSDAFAGLEGPGIVDAPAFQENILAFPVCFGLCLQGLVDTVIGTNLVPREMVTERMVRAKKPWAVASLAAMTLGLVLSYFFYWRVCQTVDAGPFKDAEAQVNQFIAKANKEKQEYAGLVSKFEADLKTGQHLMFDREKKMRWIKLFRAIDVCLPRDVAGKEPAIPTERRQIFITSITARKRDLAEWYQDVRSGKARGAKTPGAGSGGGMPGGGGGMPGGGGGGMPGGGGGMQGGGGGMQGGGGGMQGGGGGMQGGGGGMQGGAGGRGGNSGTAAETPVEGGPTGIGYVVTIEGYHFHNQELALGDAGKFYLEKTLIETLSADEIRLPGPEGAKEIVVPVKKLGIGFPMVVTDVLPDYDESKKVPNPWYDEYRPKPKDKNGKEIDDPTNPKKLPRYDFVVEFVWSEAEADQPASGAGNQLAARP
jgi:type IV pilus assembly protein PilM